MCKYHHKFHSNLLPNLHLAYLKFFVRMINGSNLGALILPLNGRRREEQQLRVVNPQLIVETILFLRLFVKSESLSDVVRTDRLNRGQHSSLRGRGRCHLQRVGHCRWNLGERLYAAFVIVSLRLLRCNSIKILIIVTTSGRSATCWQRIKHEVRGELQARHLRAIFLWLLRTTLLRIVEWVVFLIIWEVFLHIRIVVEMWW